MAARRIHVFAVMNTASNSRHHVCVEMDSPQMNKHVNTFVDYVNASLSDELSLSVMTIVGDQACDEHIRHKRMMPYFKSSYLMEYSSNRIIKMSRRTVNRLNTANPHMVNTFTTITNALIFIGCPGVFLLL